MNCSSNDSNQKISIWRITTKAISHEENIMTVIVYGKSTFAGNAKTRRHERRRKLAIERDSICNIIDSIFGTDSEEPVQEDPRKRLSLSEKAISLGSLRCKKVDECSGSVCLPNVAIYAAGYRKSKQLTARVMTPTY